MREGLFWLDDLQWSSIKGCLPLARIVSAATDS
jgi:hypothetical protein